MGQRQDWQLWVPLRDVLLTEIAQETGVAGAVVLSRNRDLATAEARSVLVWALYRAGANISTLSVLLGRDHSTICWTLYRLGITKSFPHGHTTQAYPDAVQEDIASQGIQVLMRAGMTPPMDADPNTAPLPVTALPALLRPILHDTQLIDGVLAYVDLLILGRPRGKACLAAWALRTLAEHWLLRARVEAAFRQCGLTTAPVLLRHQAMRLGYVIREEAS